ncbi:hypothetical protein ARMGADRAFT_1093268 [Armillaria gallica]|uniref:Uncharacterized protein n=1 Tax=Armillaria gallica TaxID=47427 RepID=A0A2H3CDB3_ARMGA|nr:hypothetical protein ARMGADRAFT_1093268 [Armillaria gallica]
MKTASQRDIELSEMYGVSQTLTAQIGVPDIAQVTDGLTISTEVMDTALSSYVVPSLRLRLLAVKVIAEEGQHCTTVTSTKTCNTQASGNIHYLVSGWIWFNYDDQTKDHYKWAVHIEEVLTNQDDRSSFAIFKGSMDTVTMSYYDPTCI